MQDLKLFIDGEFVGGEGDPTFESINPFTNQPWARLIEATQGHVDSAVQAAQRAFPEWARTSGAERARLLHRLADLLEAAGDEYAVAESSDNGKVIRETRRQMDFAARQYRYFAGWADKIHGNVIPTDQQDTLDVMVRKPIGPVALITAWNSPIGHLSNKLAPALAAGCTVVVKPSEHASVTTAMFADLVKKAGFPDGVVNILTGAGATGSALVTHPGIRKVSFTGSPGVGAKIAESVAANITPLTLELGGKSPNIIFEDANLDRAITGALAGIFAATGQTCIAGSRLLVHSSIHDQVVQALKARAEQIVLGDPTDFATEMGPVANRNQYEAVLSMIQMAKDEGVEVVTGGSGVQRGDGLFIAPTIFSGVTNSMRIAQEEVFGPVLSILTFDDEEEAIRIANDSNFGLAAGVWTDNIHRAMRVSQALLAGSVWVNTYRAIGAQIPFGGFKQSGYGRERGYEGLMEFVATQNILFDYSEDARDPFALKA